MRMSPLDGDRRLTSAITRGPLGPRRTVASRPLAAGSSAAAARTSFRGSRPARRSASDLASATARARNEPVEVTADDSNAPSGNVGPVGLGCLILAGRRVGGCVRRATPSQALVLVWVARGQAGPAPLVMLVAAAVTSCRHDTGPAVLDGHTLS